MAAFRKREENYYYFVEQRTKTSRPLQKVANDGELHHLPRRTNNFDHDLFFDYPAPSRVGEVRSTIDSKEAAERYGGISIIDYYITKKPAAAAAAAFRFLN